MKRKKRVVWQKTDEMNSEAKMEDIALKMTWNVFIFKTVEGVGGVCNDPKAIEVT